MSSLTRAAFLFYHRNDVAAGAQGYDNVTIEGTFSSTSQLQFLRSDTENAINGHWYVLEALDVGGNYAFSVQTKTFTFTGASGSAALTPGVDSSKTLVIGSYRSPETQDHPDQGSLRLYLTGCVGTPSICPTVGAAQAQVGDGSATSVTAHVVTFADGIRVQRGSVAYVAGTTLTSATLASVVNVAAAMAWNGFAMGPGVMLADTGAGALMPVAHQLLKLTNAATVQAERSTTDDVATGSWEVVEWQPSGQPLAVMRVESGRYVGNGTDNRPIFVGFQPDVVIVDREDLTVPNPNDEAVIRTSTMIGDVSKDMDVGAGGNAVGANRIQSLDANGFTVGTDNNVNQNTITYYWVAFKAAPGQLKVGSFAGTNPAQNIAGVGFSPVYLMVISEGAFNVVQKSVFMAANFSEDFIALGYTDAILDIQADGFRVGTNDIVNVGGTVSHYVAWAPVAGRVAVGRYTGGAPADDRAITGTGFWPEWVVLSRSSNAAGIQGNPPVHKPASTGVTNDWAPLFDGTQVEANNIQELLPDGFEVGGHQRVNNALAPNTYYWAAFGPHSPGVNYRSIGPALDYATGTVLATSGSAQVLGTGTAWKTANRGRGDRMPIAGSSIGDYTVAAVVSDTELYLTVPYQGTNGGGKAFSLQRKFDQPSEWVNCIDGPLQAGCGVLEAGSAAVSSNSLVADDRVEVGILYNDDGPDAGTLPDPFLPPCGGCEIAWITGMVTDASHTVTLTVDAGNRHSGVAWSGAGATPHVVFDNSTGTVDAVVIWADFVTVEWLEVRSDGGGHGIGAAYFGVTPSAGAVNNTIVLRNNLVHDVADGIKVGGTSINADVYNNFVYDVARGINPEATQSADPALIRVFNNTVYNATGEGIVSGVNAQGRVQYRNNISITTGGSNYLVVGTLRSPSSDNLSGDATATSVSPDGGAEPGIALSSVNFVSVTPGAEDLHLNTGSYAIGLAADLSAFFRIDIDGGLRPGAWDIGADEFGVTTAVKLQSFAAVAGDAAVALEWRTASELSNLGFHLYRGLSERGPWARLTAVLIPGLGSSATGQAYSFRDLGLANGTRYFYRLEDVDASSKTTAHGPVSAVPLAGAAGGAPGSEPEASGAKKKGASAPSCPDWVVAAYGSMAGSSRSSATLTCTRHGDPEAGSLGVVSRDSRSATLELRTGGFYSLREASGVVRVFVPGFDFPQDPQTPALPFRRALVDAVVGRRVQLGGVRALDQVGFKGLVPAALGKVEMQVSGDGTVRAGRRAVRELAPQHVPLDLARLLPSVFQGETKSAVVQLTPLRYDARRQQIVLAKRVLVKLLFTGRETGENGRGSIGRREKPQPPPAGELLARLYTTSRGLHAVSFEQLFPGRQGSLASAQLRLERRGQAQGFHMAPASASFGPGSVLYFHADATASSTEFSSETAWELLRAQGGVQMPLVSAPPSADAVTTASTGRAAFETNRFYQPGLLEAPDLWLWEGLASGTTRAKSFSLTGVNAASSEAAELEVFLQGASESGNPVDHHMSVSLNGTLAGEAQFAGKKPFRMSLSVPLSLLREGANELSLTNVADTGVSSFVFLDRFAISFPQTSSLAGGVFEGTWNEGGTVALAGLTAPAALLDVTAAEASGSGALWLTGHQATGGTLRFRAEAGHRYLAVSQQALLTPRVAAQASSTLRAATNQADYLLIAPRAFLAAAEPLLERRSDQGLASRRGRVRGHLGRVRARPALRGGHQGLPRPCLPVVGAAVPALRAAARRLELRPEELHGHVSAVAAAGAVDEDELPLDRLRPAARRGQRRGRASRHGDRTAAGRDAWTRRSCSSRSSSPGRTRPRASAGAATLVADNPDLAGDFEADVGGHRAELPCLARGRRVLKLQRAGGSRRGRRSTTHSNSGLSFLSYVGHGGAAVWASENVWNSWDAPSLQAQSRQPFLLTMNCLNGYFVAPAFDSLAESLLKAEGRGAIAAFSPSGLSARRPGAPVPPRADGRAHERPTPAAGRRRPRGAESVCRRSG